MRTAFRELGPLRSLVLHLVIGQTAGTVLVLWKLPALAAVVPPGQHMALFWLLVAMTVAVAAALVLPSAAAFAAGYCCGVFAGGGSAVLAIAIGSVLARQYLVPRLGPRLFAFMQGRPRVTAVRRFCRGGVTAATFAVARLRWGAVFPLAAANVLFAVASVPSVAVFRGSVLGALPATIVAAAAGDALRTWSATRALPETHSWLGAAAALIAMALLWRASRRLWRASAAPLRDSAPA
jgi:uncharacterized membrane protein YdjX (TVP38/TMEM64 family)